MKYEVSVTIHNTYYVEVLERGGMDYEAYKAATWQALGQWMGTGRDTGKLDAIAARHGVLSGDVEDMLTDCLD